MSNFSEKYNIKINNKGKVIEILSLSNTAIKEKEYKIAELYFVSKKIDLDKISKFNEIYDFGIITVDNTKKEVTLYRDNIYTASLTDILTASKLLYIFGYEVLFSIKRTVYKYLYGKITFYIQYIENKGYFLTFDENICQKDVAIILDFLCKDINFMLDSNMYYDVIEEAFKENK